jgi:monoamine oxidase
MGFHVTVVEARTRPGGRILTLRGAGYVFAKAQD